MYFYPGDTLLRFCAVGRNYKEMAGIRKMKGGIRLLTGYNQSLHAKEQIKRLDGR
jgi:hypothetical protein